MILNVNIRFLRNVNVITVFCYHKKCQINNFTSKYGPKIEKYQQDWSKRRKKLNRNNFIPQYISAAILSCIIICFSKYFFPSLGFYDNTYINFVDIRLVDSDMRDNCGELCLTGCHIWGKITGNQLWIRIVSALQKIQNLYLDKSIIVISL